MYFGCLDLYLCVWICMLVVWTCILVFWTCILDAWTRIWGVWTCIFGVWTCVLGFWTCILKFSIQYSCTFKISLDRCLLPCARMGGTEREAVPSAYSGWAMECLYQQYADKFEDARAPVQFCSVVHSGPASIVWGALNTSTVFSRAGELLSRDLPTICESCTL